jgi:hypothetical protein
MHSTAPTTAATIMSPVNADGWPDERNELKRNETPPRSSPAVNKLAQTA